MAAACLHMGGSHSLEQFINGVARDIEDPETQMTVWQRDQLTRSPKPARPKNDRNCGSAPTCASRRSAPAPTTLRFSITSASPRWISAYGGEDERESITPSTTIFTGTRISPTRDFVYGRALAQTVGTSVMRLADAEVLPFEFVNLADTVGEYRRTSKSCWPTKQEEIREQNQELEEGVFTATTIPGGRQSRR